MTKVKVHFVDGVPETKTFQLENSDPNVVTRDGIVAIGRERTELVLKISSLRYVQIINEDSNA